MPGGTEKDCWDRSIDGVPLAPESLMMGYGYEPAWSEGSLKTPIFQTSTFVFETAEDGKRFFEVAYGLREAEDGEKLGMIYSRLSNPDLEILEDRLRLWDGADKALVFASGMAAISTAILAHVRPGEVIIHSAPLYGGTDHLLAETLPDLGILTVEWEPGMTKDEIAARLGAEAPDAPLAFILIETPANPTLDLFDIEVAADLAREHSTEERKVPVAVDNTFLGPVFQHPLEHGADLVIYSATKYIGGHSDLVAGAVLGSSELVAPIAQYRSVLGTMATPLTGWLLMRSLETLSLRMHRQVENAARVAGFLNEHPKVRAVHYLGLLDPDSPAYDVYKRQCLAPGGMIAFEIDGGEHEAFTVLNALRLIKLAVSLGGTESLAEHPATMTHIGVDPAEKEKLGVTESLIRLSVGVEHPDDIIRDLGAALRTI